ncbi:hypothetical protein HZB04_02300 [Candidatus Wolfebacteria bacterium]|nr:hypothetical protein [Candidatus Wolfebacteria bacterium]
MNTLQTNIIKELGLENLSDERKMEIMLGVGRIVQQNVILRILDELKEKDKDEFDKFLEKNEGNEEAIYKFLKSKIFNLDDIINEEIKKIKGESIDLMQKIV